MKRRELILLNQKLFSQNKKYCIKCKEILPIEKYGKDLSKHDNLTHLCLECKNIDYRVRFKTSNKGREKSKLQYHGNKDKYKNWELIRLFGITLEDYNRMLKEQNNVCYICNKPETSKRRKKLSVDHCHKTNKVRGLLCSNCNLGLGNFQDNIEFLEKAILYLKK
jgi:hypothetical protein